MADRREELQRRHAQAQQRLTGGESQCGGKPVGRCDSPLPPAKIASSNGATPPPRPATPAVAGAGRQPTVRQWLLIGAAAIVVVTILAGVGFWVLGRIGGSPDQQLAAAAKRLEQGVGLVVVIIPDSKGEGRPVPVGSAWAVQPKLLVTNAHISEPVRMALAKKADVFVYINRRPDVKLRVIAAWSHPNCFDKARNATGAAPVAFNHDVGILRLEEAVPVVLPVADQDELAKLASGYRVAYLGFPMENMEGRNVDVASPVATMQSGIVTSISDFWMGDGGFAKNLLVRHNMGAAGGASGSPIFNAKGEVVAVLNAGNVMPLVVPNSQGKIEIQRIPSAAMVNFAQRADLVNDALAAEP